VMKKNRYKTAVVIKVEPKHYGLYLKKKRKETRRKFTSHLREETLL
jgi:hypothetical protein